MVFSRHSQSSHVIYTSKNTLLDVPYTHKVSLVQPYNPGETEGLGGGGDQNKPGLNSVEERIIL